MQIKGMGGFLDGIDRIDFIDYYRQGQTIIDGMDVIDGIDFIDYYRQDRLLQTDGQDGRNGHMRQDKPQKKRDTCWQKC